MVAIIYSCCADPLPSFSVITHLKIRCRNMNVLATDPFRRSPWRHEMETFSALLAICAGNSPFPGEFPTQRPVTRSFDVFFDLRLNKRLSKQSWGWWFKTPSRPLWCHRNDYLDFKASQSRLLWWRHDVETPSALLVLGESMHLLQRAIDLELWMCLYWPNKLLIKQPKAGVLQQGPLLLTWFNFNTNHG